MSTLLPASHHPPTGRGPFPSDQVICCAAWRFSRVRAPGGAVILMHYAVKIIARLPVPRGFPGIFEAAKLAKTRAIVFFAPRRPDASRCMLEVAKKHGQPAQGPFPARNSGFFGYPGGWLRNRALRNLRKRAGGRCEERHPLAGCASCRRYSQPASWHLRAARWRGLLKTLATVRPPRRWPSPPLRAQVAARRLLAPQ
jgi:hypothetical protein